jgi:hypothetical protein
MKTRKTVSKMIETQGPLASKLKSIAELKHGDNLLSSRDNSLGVVPSQEGTVKYKNKYDRLSENSVFRDFYIKSSARSIDKNTTQLNALWENKRNANRELLNTRSSWRKGSESQMKVK